VFDARRVERRGPVGDPSLATFDGPGIVEVVDGGVEVVDSV
jgi:hypothetical protein